MGNCQPVSLGGINRWVGGRHGYGAGAWGGELCLSSGGLAGFLSPDESMTFHGRLEVSQRLPSEASKSCPEGGGAKRGLHPWPPP